MLYAVIMAGGSGTRFWPQSRHARPKQLLRLAGERTMIQATVDRAAGSIPPERTWIVTNREQAAATAAQLPELPAENLLAEPCGRNTAPCIGLAAIRLRHADPEAVMLVMPADHVIGPQDKFASAVEQAAGVVERNPRALVLFGVPPDRPATGYGYIERGAASEDGQSACFRVESFREKPDAATAREYVAAGRFYWNCGIFVWRADRILQALREFEPEIHQRLLSLQETIGTDRFDEALQAEFPRMKKISIDYAVLERSKDSCVIEAPFEWDDVGSWESLPRLMGTDAQGNAVDAFHVGLDTHNCVIRGTGDEHLIATLGVEDLVIVHTPDATLVARRGNDAAIRDLVEELKSRGCGRLL